MRILNKYRIRFPTGFPSYLPSCSPFFAHSFWIMFPNKTSAISLPRPALLSRQKQFVSKEYVQRKANWRVIQGNMREKKCLLRRKERKRKGSGRWHKRKNLTPSHSSHREKQAWPFGKRKTVGSPQLADPCWAWPCGFLEGKEWSRRSRVPECPWKGKRRTLTKAWHLATRGLTSSWVWMLNRIIMPSHLYQHKKEGSFYSLQSIIKMSLRNTHKHQQMPHCKTKPLVICDITYNKKMRNVGR